MLGRAGASCLVESEKPLWSLLVVAEEYSCTETHLVAYSPRPAHWSTHDQCGAQSTQSGMVCFQKERQGLTRRPLFPLAPLALRLELFSAARLYPKRLYFLCLLRPGRKPRPPCRQGPPHPQDHPPSQAPKVLQVPI